MVTGSRNGPREFTFLRAAFLSVVILLPGLTTDCRILVISYGAQYAALGSHHEGPKRHATSCACGTIGRSDAESSERKGEIPKDRKHRDQLVREFTARYQNTTQAKRQVNNADIYIQLSTIHYHPSVAPMATLEKVFIKDVQLEVHPRGKYILLRTATRAVHLASIVVIVEDELGDGMTLQIAHQEESHEQRK